MSDKKQHMYETLKRETLFLNIGRETNRNNKILQNVLITTNDRNSKNVFITINDQNITNRSMRLRVSTESLRVRDEK